MTRTILAALALIAALTLSTHVAAQGPVYVPIAARQYTPCLPDGDDVGSVSGRVLLRDGSPFWSGNLYLAEWWGWGTRYQAILLSLGHSPLAVTDANGDYCYRHVAPGVYGLVIWEAVESWLVNGPDGHTLAVHVRGGEMTTLPDVRYEGR
jgi:hypothetical protein